MDSETIDIKTSVSVLDRLPSGVDSSKEIIGACFTGSSVNVKR